MGTGCLVKVNKVSVSHESLQQSQADAIKLTQRKKLIFQAPGSEMNFNELSTPRSGRHIQWRRGDLIGEGAYAKVYQCLNIETGELMAVKTFIVTFTQISDNPRKIEREFFQLRKEIRLLKNLRHDNIVHYYQADLSEDLKSVDVLLEYIPGGSLKVVLYKYQSLELPVIRNYAKQLLEGLKYLHSNKIMHRDLKPANVLISPTGVLKLTDFGSSKQFDDLETVLTKSLKGSPYWMAPEVVRLEGHSFPADIWSFGCILIEMSTGKPPWSNISNESKAVMKLIGKDDMLPEFPIVDSQLDKIIRLCVARDPAVRPTADELLELSFFQ